MMSLSLPRTKDLIPKEATGYRSMKMVTVRMSLEQRETLKEKARLENMTVQAYCIRRLFTVVDDSREWKDAAD